jgi:thiamine biosynthesis lipoprotein
MSTRRRQRPLLGTFVEIATEGATGHADAAISAAFDSIAAVHRVASFQEPESELSRLNRAGGEPAFLSPLLFRILFLARGMMRASDDVFNCTIGGALVRRGVLPDHGWQNYSSEGISDDIEFRRHCVRLHNGVLVTLDGIAKGFAVDLAVRTLKRHGVEAGWVNAGGDMRVFGDIGLPITLRSFDNRLLEGGILRNASVATSRADLKFDPRFPGTIVGARGHDPKTGIWSVSALQAWRADALTKVAALTPQEECAETIGRLKGGLLFLRDSIAA